MNRKVRSFRAKTSASWRGWMFVVIDAAERGGDRFLAEESAGALGLLPGHAPKDALRDELGIMGGSGGPGQPSITFQGSGLKIWASWESINMVQDKPLFAGRSTIVMAREVYGILDPSDRQTSLF
jgi:hypothetical protein